MLLMDVAIINLPLFQTHCRTKLTEKRNKWLLDKFEEYAFEIGN